VRFLLSLDSLTRRVCPVGRRLERPAEDALNRHCVVLAFGDRSFSPGPATQLEMLGGVAGQRTVSDLLAMATDAWLADLRALSWAAHETLGDLLAGAAEDHPVFAGSGDVGGARADLILDGCLVDIKTTVRPRWDRAWLDQLLGYALLDYPDRYRIRAIGLYLARQCLLIRWPLDQVLATLADGRSPPLDELRCQLLEVLKREKLGLGGGPSGAAPSFALAGRQPTRRPTPPGGRAAPPDVAVQLSLPNLLA
jgi:hypothetical protein